MSASSYHEIDDLDERRRAVALIDELQRRSSGTAPPCPDCSATVCGHQYVMNAAMGFKDSPRCVVCLAAALDQPIDGFLSRVRTYVADRLCFATAWAWADGDEGTAGETTPACVVLAGESDAPESAVVCDQGDGSNEGPAEHGAAWDAESDAQWDADDMSCGDLVLELRMRLMRLEPGQVLALRAIDPAAPVDLPAWCGLTGHTLVASDHPQYQIRRKSG